MVEKKVRTFALDQRREWIREDPKLSIRQQCRLTGVSRSGYYYEPEPETEENLELMRLLDQQYLNTPFWGVRNMTWWLGKQGWHVNSKRVRRLLRLMGLETIYAKPRLSIPAPGHRIYPYLLRDVTVDHPDQCWASDITYIRMREQICSLLIDR